MFELRENIGNKMRLFKFFRRIPVEWKKHNYGGLWYVLKLAWYKSI